MQLASWRSRRTDGVSASVSARSKAGEAPYLSVKPGGSRESSCSPAFCAVQAPAGGVGPIGRTVCFTQSTHSDDFFQKHPTDTSGTRFGPAARHPVVHESDLNKR